MTKKQISLSGHDFPISQFPHFEISQNKKKQISLSTPLRDRSRKDDSESCGMISIGIKYDRFVAKECHNCDLIKRMMTDDIIGTLLKGWWPGTIGNYSRPSYHAAPITSRTVEFQSGARPQSDSPTKQTLSTSPHHTNQYLKQKTVKSTTKQTVESRKQIDTKLSSKWLVTSFALGRRTICFM